MKRRKLTTICTEVMRYYPPLVALLMCLHIICLLAGYSHWVEGVIFDCSLLGTILLMIASYAFEFCIWHRLCVLYAYAVSVCIDYQRAVGFAHLTFMRLLMLSVGITILIMFVIRCIRRLFDNTSNV